MIIVTIKYIYNNPELCEINDITERTRLERDQKYDVGLAEEVEVKLNVKFLDKINNKTKNIKTKNIKKAVIASQNKYELFKINNLSILIEGIINKNVINTDMKSDKIPSLWRKIFLKIAKNRDVCK